MRLGLAAISSGTTVAEIVGWELLIGFAFAVVLFVLPVVAIVQVASTPDERFRATGRNKTAWLLVLILGWFLCGIVSFVASLVWLLSVRPLVASSSSPTPLPPGWFADPSRRHEMRYWDGARWSEHVSDSGTPSIDPP